MKIPLNVFFPIVHVLDRPLIPVRHSKQGPSFRDYCRHLSASLLFYGRKHRKTFLSVTARFSWTGQKNKNHLQTRHRVNRSLNDQLLFQLSCLADRFLFQLSCFYRVISSNTDLHSGANSAKVHRNGPLKNIALRRRGNPTAFSQSLPAAKIANRQPGQ